MIRKTKTFFTTKFSLLYSIYHHYVVSHFNRELMTAADLSRGGTLESRTFRQNRVSCCRGFYREMEDGFGAEGFCQTLQ